MLIPLDHGPWLGPVRGIDRPREITRKVLAGGANALLVTPGFLKDVHDLFLDTGIGRDDTIFATRPGTVEFRTGRKGRLISVAPVE